MCRLNWANACKCLVLLSYLSLGLGVQATSAALLPVGTEIDSWSDMVLSGAAVDYDSGTGAFSIVRAAGGTQVEIGGEFGPGNPGTHYGTGGTLGGLGGGSPFSASLDVSGVTVGAGGVVSAGGTITVTYEAPPEALFAGDLASDYGIDAGDTLLEGTILEVLLGATGTGTLDVLFSITGGALQTGVNSEPTLAGVPFSGVGLGVLRIAAGAPSLPGDWSSSFSVASATMDVLGIPEPTSLGLALIAGLYAISRRRAITRR